MFVQLRRVFILRGFKLPCVLCLWKYINVRFKSGRNSLTFIRQIVFENKFRCCLLKWSKSCPGKDTYLFYQRFNFHKFGYIYFDLYIVKSFSFTFLKFMLDINVFKKCRYEIFPPFFARICMFSSKFRPRNTDHRLEIKTKFINSSFITDKKLH